MMEAEYVHSSSPQCSPQRPPQPQKRTWSRNSSSSSIPSSFPQASQSGPRQGLSRPKGQSSSASIGAANTPPRKPSIPSPSGHTALDILARVNNGAAGKAREGGSRATNSYNGNSKKKAAPRSRYADSESDDMPTPTGVRDPGVPVVPYKSNAFDRVHALLNGKGKADTQSKKRKNHVDSPDPIDSLSSPPGSPTSPSRSRASSKQSNGPTTFPWEQPVKPSKDRYDDRDKKKATSSKLSSQRTTSIVSVSSTSSKADAESELDATPKAKPKLPRKALPSFRKKYDDPYTEDGFKKDAEDAEKAKIASDGAKFFREVDQDLSLLVAEDQREKIREETRKKLEEQQEEENKQRIKLEAEKRKRKAETATTAAFFAGVKRDARLKRDDATPTKADSLMNLQLSSPEVAFEPMKLTAEEEYLLRFADPANLCPYCAAPMPKNPSADLLAMRHRLKTAKSATERWAFCAFHKAETTAIPLGLREGYLDEVDFESLHLRLESGFIRLRLRQVVAKPADSTLFRRTQRDIQAKGHNGWQEANVQAEAMRLATPGYYGDLGKQVIILHFQQLFQWGFLPSLSDEIYPLSQTDFILNVLVPEAATLLIMQDRGWSKPRARGEGWQDALKEARLVRMKSSEFGRWRFRQEGEEGQRVLKEITSERHADEKHEMLERYRDRDASKVKRKAAIKSTRTDFVEDPMDIGSASDSGTADVSEWGDDEVDWGQATAALDLHARVDIPKPEPLPPRESFTRKESQSSATFESWDDGFTNEAIQQMDRNGWA